MSDRFELFEANGEGLLLDVETGEIYRLNAAALREWREHEDEAARALPAPPIVESHAPYTFSEERGALTMRSIAGSTLAIIAADGSELDARSRDAPDAWLMWAVPHLAALQGRTVLHASAVLADRVLAFSGESGSGKTSAARAFVSGGARPVSEDLLPYVRGRVAIEGERLLRGWAIDAASRVRSGQTVLDARAIGEAWCGETVPLGSIAYLEAACRSGEVFRFTALDPLEAIVRAMLNAFAEVPSSRVWRAVWATSIELATMPAIELVAATVPEGLEAMDRAVAAELARLRRS